MTNFPLPPVLALSDEVIRQHFTDVEILQGSAWSKLQKREWETALTTLREADELRPKDPVTTALLALTYAHLGAIELARTAATSAKSLNPDDAWVSLVIAHTYWACADHKAAFTELKTTQEARPSVDGALQMAQWNLENGSPTSAQGWAEEAHELAPNDPRPSNLLIDIDRALFEEAQKQHDATTKRNRRLHRRLPLAIRQAYRSSSVVNGIRKGRSKLRIRSQWEEVSPDPRIPLLESALTWVLVIGILSIVRELSHGPYWIEDILNIILYGVLIFTTLFWRHYKKEAPKFVDEAVVHPPFLAITALWALFLALWFDSGINASEPLFDARPFIAALVGTVVARWLIRQYSKWSYRTYQLPYQGSEDSKAA